MLQKTTIANGNTVVSGFSDEGKFLAAEAIPQYVVFEYVGHEELTTTQIGFEIGDQDLEIVSIVGGGYVGDGFSSWDLTSIYVTKKAGTSSTYPDNIVTRFAIGAPLPYMFEPGFILPAGSRGFMSLNGSVATLRMYCKPVGRLNTQPLFILP